MRSAAERERDLGDIAELWDKYVADDDDRRFEDRVLAAELAWENVSAHELGVDESRVVTAAEHACIEQLLSSARGGDALGTLGRLLRFASFAREERETRLMGLDAFVRGLGLG